MKRRKEGIIRNDKEKGSAPKRSKKERKYACAGD